MKRLAARLLALLMLLLPVLSGCAQSAVSSAVPAPASSSAAVSSGVAASSSAKEAQSAPEVTNGEAVTSVETLLTSSVIDEEGWYDTKDEVALYLMKYGQLPGNYITKKEAQALGWEGGSLTEYAPGKSIGGDRFGNYEGALPAADGRTYQECDIGTVGQSSRGAKRIVFSNDGLIYYTEDHYATFVQLQGKEAQQ